jgi:hypothetical protein
MANSYIGVNGIARKVIEGYVGVDGVARKIKKAYIGVNGVARRIPRLPTAYQEVEYVFFKDGAEINTELRHGDCDEIFALFKRAWTSYGAIFGNYIDENTECTRCLYYNNERSRAVLTTFQSKANAGGTYLEGCVDYNNYNEVHMVLESTLRQVATINGKISAHVHVAGNTNTTPIVLGKSRHGTTVPSVGVYMKYFIVKKSGKEIRNFVPCYRKSDNVAGMYDIVNDVFYSNPSECPGNIEVGGDA